MLTTAAPHINKTLVITIPLVVVVAIVIIIAVVLTPKERMLKLASCFDFNSRKPILPITEHPQPQPQPQPQKTFVARHLENLRAWQKPQSLLPVIRVFYPLWTDGNLYLVAFTLDTSGTTVRVQDDVAAIPRATAQSHA